MTTSSKELVVFCVIKALLGKTHKHANDKKKQKLSKAGSS